MKLDVPQFLGVGIPIFLCPTELTEIPTRLPHHRIHYYLQDHLNSANLLTDAAGNVLEETIFYPFGHTRASWSQAALHGLLPSQYLFSQNERDRESGLDCFGARYLVAFLGRFGSVDPAIETMPQEGLLNPQLLHGYGYAHNNPLKYIDPKGEFAFWAVGAGIGAGVGAAVHTARFIFSKKYRQECQTWRGQEMTGGKVWKGTKGFLKGLAKSVVYGAIGGAIAGSFIDTAGGTALAGGALVGYSTLGGAVGGGGAALLSEGGEVISELARKAIPGKEAVKRLGKAVAVGAALGTVFGAIGGGIGAGVNLSQAGSVVADVGVALAEETGAALSETAASGPSTAAPQAQPPPSVSRRPSTAAPQTQPPSVSRGPEEEEMIQL
jgi:RHS repeat-associated protein